MTQLNAKEIIELYDSAVALEVKQERERIINLLLDLNVIRRAEAGKLVAFDTNGEKVVYLTGLENDK